MTEQFIRNGFLVETPPPLHARFVADWDDEYSLPYYEDGELRCKPVVYYNPDKKSWGIKFKGVYNSGFMHAFSSPGDAGDWVRYTLKVK